MLLIQSTSPNNRGYLIQSINSICKKETTIKRDPTYIWIRKQKTHQTICCACPNNYNKLPNEMMLWSSSVVSTPTSRKVGPWLKFQMGTLGGFALVQWLTHSQWGVAPLHKNSTKFFLKTEIKYFYSRDNMLKQKNLNNSSLGTPPNFLRVPGPLFLFVHYLLIQSLPIPYYYIIPHKIYTHIHYSNIVLFLAFFTKTLLLREKFAPIQWVIFNIKQNTSIQYDAVTCFDCHS